MRKERPAGFVILDVRHGSRVAAIPTAAGPTRLLEAGLAEAMGASGLPVDVVELESPVGGAAGEVAASFAIANLLARRVRETLRADRMAVVLAGSCHTGIGSLSGIPKAARGVIWLDGHGDFNTPETTESGLLDGMTLAGITGRCWERMSSRVTGFSPVPDDRVLLIGARSLDEGEAALLEGSDIVRIPAEDAPSGAPGALRALGERAGGVYLHLDLDVLDPSVGMANAHATEGGLSRSDLRALVEVAVESCPLRAVAFASYDPSADEKGTVSNAALEIARVLAERIAA